MTFSRLDFINDVKLIHSNSALFNGDVSEYTINALNLLETAQEQVQLQSVLLDQIEETLKKESDKFVSKVSPQRRSRGRPPGSKNKKEKPIKIRNQTTQKSQVVYDEERNEPAYAEHPVEVKEEIVNDESMAIEIGSKLILTLILHSVL